MENVNVGHIEQVEVIPATYPAVTGLSVAAAALDPAMIWQRIEDYIAYRWTARAVVWTVEGPGEWEPPLTPSTVSAVEVWGGAASHAATIAHALRRPMNSSPANSSDTTT